ncbi:unnamed protein product [Caenorhabditis auriculariae]|uniref:Uncharacterized protein n=1 Tax=Caenorhabditis auriculariae TaxID=2777116 RepID=A0A8S1GPY3_9PELO|nr:unnamed protein product [Caenorhabditis auriculariae]
MTGLQDVNLSLAEVIKVFHKGKVAENLDPVLAETLKLPEKLELPEVRGPVFAIFENYFHRAKMLSVVDGELEKKAWDFVITYFVQKRRVPSREELVTNPFCFLFNEWGQDALEMSKFFTNCHFYSQLNHQLINQVKTSADVNSQLLFFETIANKVSVSIEISLYSRRRLPPVLKTRCNYNTIDLKHLTLEAKKYLLKGKQLGQYITQVMWPAIEAAVQKTAE